MSYVDELREAHKARRQRLGMISLPRKQEPVSSVPAAPEKIAPPECPPVLEAIIKDTIECVMDRIMGHGQAAPQPTLASIISDLAREHGVSVEDIKGACRVARIMKARLEFYYLAARDTSASYPRIGRFCGSRDHTTVLSGIGQYCHRNKVPHPRNDTSVYAERRRAQRLKYKLAIEELRSKREAEYQRQLSSVPPGSFAVIRDPRGRFELVRN